MPNDFNKAEVTIFFREDPYRDIAGYNKKAITLLRMARIKYDDGTESFCTFDIQLNDYATGNANVDARPVFFLERNDVRDNEDGNVFNELKVHAGGDV